MRGVKLAYFIPLHIYPNLCKRMFRTVYDPENLYLIHIDKKSDPAFHKEIREFLSPYSNVRFLPSEDAVYCGYSTLALDLKAIREFLKEEWDFFLNVSGQDFPLKTQAYIRNYLKDLRDRNFIHVLDVETQWRKARFRAWWYFVEFKINSPILRRKRVWPLPILRSYPKEYKRYAGSAFCILNREFCEYLTFDPSLDRLKKFLKHTYIPEEEFFQTAIMNSPFKDTLINSSKRMYVTVGKRAFDKLARMVGLRGYYYSRQQILTMQYLDRLTATDAFFARKFDENVDTEIVDVLESRLLSASATAGSA